MNGLGYLVAGGKLAVDPKLRWYVLLPLLVNIILVGSLFSWAYSLITGWQAALDTWLPSWLEWLTWFLEPLFYIAAVAFLAYGFSTLANLIASPFNGLLAEAVEAHLDPGITMPESSASAVLKSVPRAIYKELAKIIYYLPRLILVWLSGFIIPGANIVLGLLLSMWMMALQYIDYPMDNHQKSFKQVKIFTGQRKSLSLSFGAFVLLFTAIPIANLFIMPIAVCGATKLWVDTKHSQNNKV